MVDLELKSWKVADLLRTQSRIVEELRERKIVRSSNGPTGDYAEFLFCKSFGWTQVGNSAKGFDATDSQSNRYQIKGRRPTRYNRSRQVSVIRDLPSKPFEFLAGVLFAEDYSVAKAALVPFDTVRAESKQSDRVRGWIFHLKDSIWDSPGVRDVTSELVKTAKSL
jgi:hypothetical protein